MTFIDVFAIYIPSLCKRTAHKSEQLASFFVGLCRGHETDVHAADLIYLVVFYLREYQLFLDTHRIVSSSVKGIGINTAEVTDTRKCKIEESIHEIVGNVNKLSTHLNAYQAHMTKLGNSLGTTVNAYNTANKEFVKIDKDVTKITGDSFDSELLQLDKPSED